MKRVLLGMKVNIDFLYRDTLDKQKTLKLTNSSNNKESIPRTIVGARTTEPQLYLFSEAINQHTTKKTEMIECNPHLLFGKFNSFSKNQRSNWL